MKNKNFITGTAIALFLCFAASYGFAADAKQAKKELTKDAILADLKKDIVENDEIFNTVPGLKAEKDKSGKASYTFKGVNIENMSKDDLDKLLISVRHALVKIRTDRIQKQLERVRQVQSTQKVSAPPQVPRTPSSMPSVPKVPPRPPAGPASSRR